MSSETTIKISQELYRKIQAGLEESGFDSVDGYVEFVMNEFLSESDKKNIRSDISGNEEKLIIEHLRSLGYLG
jgi:hypothetical protein